VRVNDSRTPMSEIVQVSLIVKRQMPYWYLQKKRIEIRLKLFL